MDVNFDGMNTTTPVEEKAGEKLEQIEQVEQVEPIHVEIKGDSSTVSHHEQTSLSNPSNDIKGLSSEEYNDPNKISVTIADKDAPIVVLFGPPQCGKTMTLIRLTRFLRQIGYTVTPIRSFRPSHDENYTSICDNFDIMMNQTNAADSTHRISFMLVNVSKNGRTICQFLEAPGEYYFNPQNPNQPFPSYFNTIKSSRNRKIWAIMVEPDWANESDRKNYVNRVKLLRRNMTVRDNTVFVYNKIDLTQFLIDNSGNTHMGAARKSVNDLFEGIFEPFRNPTPILRWFTPFRCDFTVFQTGDYTEATDGTRMYQQGPDVYPHRLWKIIMNRIKG